MTATALAGDLAAALADHGYRVAAPVRTLAGPAASRASVALTDGRHLWVDQPADGAAPLGVPVTFPAWLLRADGASVVMSDAAAVGGALVHETPWPARLLAEQLTSRAAAPERELGVALGRLLRALHQAPACALPEQSPHRPAALDRVPAARTSGLAAVDPACGAALERIVAAWSTEPVVLHGEPGTGHVLVPERPTVGPLAVLTGWSGGPRGPAWFDVGYLIGDLVEIAHLLRGVDRERVLALAAAVREGYDPAGGLPGSFWHGARDAAVVKVLDHEARIASAFGPRPDTQRFLRAVAHSILDPRSAPGSVLAATTPHE